MNSLVTLSPKQARFAQEYVLDSNGAQAAIRAGYSPNGARVKASQLLAKINVRAAVTAAQGEVQRQTGFTRQDVVALLFEAIEMARLQGDAQAMIRAVTELNRMHGYHAPEVKRFELNVTGEKFRQRLEEMTDRELEGIATLD
jgi:phage terminase small subunit